MSRLLATDGSLLFIVQIQHERHNAGNGTQGPKDRQNHLRNMYRLPRKVFPRELPTSLHSAQHGMAGNRLLPHTVYKGGKNSTWTVGFHLSIIIQDSADLSNKLGAKGAVRKCSVIANQRARWCGTPRVFPSGTIPRIFKHLGRKTKLFPSNRGTATPL